MNYRRLAKSNLYALVTSLCIRDLGRKEAPEMCGKRAARGVMFKTAR